ncbi:MAG: ComF family protein [Planctomycetes bacterium]|nr:ComF family protein [Planctomycetota bacterium]
MSHWYQGNKGFGLKVLQNTFAGLLDLLYPGICFGCNRHFSEGSAHICRMCLNCIKDDGTERCYKCGLELGLGVVSSTRGCSECKRNNLRFERGIFVSGYTGSLKELIKHYKYHKHEFLAKPLADLLINKLENEGIISEIDLIVPVPLHWRRKLTRGFNQSELFAKRISRTFHIPISVNNLYYCKNTLSQTQLSRTERNKNVSGAFDVRKPGLFSKKHILLIDDVLTTGITASECARTLDKAGAEKVFLLALARAQL